MSTRYTSPSDAAFLVEKLICETSIICGRPISSISLIFPNKTTATATFSHRHIFEIRLGHSPEKKRCEKRVGCVRRDIRRRTQTCQTADRQGQRIRQRPLAEKVKRRGRAILRKSKRRHQSERGRTFQQNAEDKNVEVLHAQRHSDISTF